MSKGESQTCVTWPIVAALVEAEKILGINRIWQPQNSLQQIFLREFFQACRSKASGLSEIVSRSSFEVAVLNQFLKSKGFSIQLQPFGPGEFGVVSILNLLVEWMIKGQRRTIETSEGKFPGVFIPKHSVEFFKAENHPYPIASLQTKSGDVVQMTVWDQPLQGFDLVTATEKFFNTRPCRDFEGVVFPMVTLDQQVNIDWLLKMEAINGGDPGYIISQALQQTKLRMNEIGARAESAVAMATRSFSLPQSPLVINRPFLIWIQREGLAKPLFVGYIDSSDWKDPGSL